MRRISVYTWRKSRMLLTKALVKCKSTSSYKNLRVSCLSWRTRSSWWSRLRLYNWRCSEMISKTMTSWPSSTKRMISNSSTTTWVKIWATARVLMARTWTKSMTLGSRELNTRAFGNKILVQISTRQSSQGVNHTVVSRKFREQSCRKFHRGGRLF